MSDLKPVSEAERTASVLREMAADLLRQAALLEQTYGPVRDPKRKVEFAFPIKKKTKKTN